MTSHGSPSVTLCKLDGTVIAQLQRRKTAVDWGSVVEKQSYMFVTNPSSETDNIQVLIDEVPLEIQRVTKFGKGWVWTIDFYAGEVEIEVRAGPRSILKTTLITDPATAKLTRGDFDTMTLEILQDTNALFRLSSHRRQIAAGATSTYPAIARLELIRSRIDRVEHAVIEIDRRPIRSLQPSFEIVPLHRVKRLNSRELTRSLTTGNVGKVRNPNAPVPAGLKGLVPRSVRQNRKIERLDIQEHRAIKQALKQWRSWLHATAGKLKRQARSNEEDDVLIHWGNRCEALARRLGNLLGLPLFAEVADVPSPVQLTSLFRRVPTYREFYRAYRDIQAALDNVGLVDDFVSVPLGQTWALYELWAFLRLVRGARALMPSARCNTDQLFTSKANALTIAASEAHVTFDNALRLSFKPKYYEFWTTTSAGRGSYSRLMEPDVSITFLHPSGQSNLDCLVILDAKYRTENDNLDAAIASIHTYRDALVERVGDQPCEIRSIVSGAYLLSPASRLIPKAARWDDQDLKAPARFFHPAYRACFRFGIVELKPGATDADTALLIQTIREDSCISN